VRFSLLYSEFLLTWRVYYSLGRLAKRVATDHGEPLDWDKDDDDALDFATAAANLRAAVFAIPSKTRWDVKRKFGSRRVRDMSN
jgi:hypothetical protein